jgi:hypothetical protein
MEEMILKPAELWQPGGPMLAGRWDVVMQNRLELRFYADLVDSETHPERSVEEVGLYTRTLLSRGRRRLSISVHIRSSRTCPISDTMPVPNFVITYVWFLFSPWDVCQIGSICFYRC